MMILIILILFTNIKDITDFNQQLDGDRGNSKSEERTVDETVGRTNGSNETLKESNQMEWDSKRMNNIEENDSRNDYKGTNWQLDKNEGDEEAGNVNTCFLRFDEYEHLD